MTCLDAAGTAPVGSGSPSLLPAGCSQNGRRLRGTVLAPSATDSNIAPGRGGRAVVAHWVSRGEREACPQLASSQARTGSRPRWRSDCAALEPHAVRFPHCQPFPHPPLANARLCVHAAARASEPTRHTPVPEVPGAGAAERGKLGNRVLRLCKRNAPGHGPRLPLSPSRGSHLPSTRGAGGASKNSTQALFGTVSTRIGGRWPGATRVALAFSCHGRLLDPGAGARRAAHHVRGRGHLCYDHRGHRGGHHHRVGPRASAANVRTVQRRSNSGCVRLRARGFDAGS